MQHFLSSSSSPSSSPPSSSFSFSSSPLSLSSPLPPSSSSNVFQTSKHIFQYFIRNGFSINKATTLFLLEYLRLLSFELPKVLNEVSDCYIHLGI